MRHSIPRYDTVEDDSWTHLPVLVQNDDRTATVSD